MPTLVKKYRLQGGRVKSLTAEPTDECTVGRWLSADVNGETSKIKSWDESKHPRVGSGEHGGEFSSGGGGSGSPKEHTGGTSLQVESHRGRRVVPSATMAKAFSDEGIPVVEDDSGITAKWGQKRVSKKLIELGWKHESFQVVSGMQVDLLSKGPMIATVEEISATSAGILVSLPPKTKGLRLVERFAFYAQKSATENATKDGYTVGDGWVEGWVSPEVIDRSGEYVPVDEWDTSEHQKNPVAFVNHNRLGPVVGRWEHPDGKYSIEKRKGGLWGRCYFNVNTVEGAEEYASYKGKFKRAFSPGFVSLRPVAGQIAGKSAKILRKAKLIEVSLVGVPENQDALAVYCKSLAKSIGNNEKPIPDGYVARYGAIPMPDTTEKKGLPAYFAKIATIADVVKDAKAILLADVPDEEERNKAYGLLEPIFSGLTQICEVGPSLAKDDPWVERAKMIGEVFEGFEKQLGDKANTVTLEEIDAMLGEKVTKLVDEKVDAKLAEPVERINELQEVVAKQGDKLTAHDAAITNHESAIENTTDALEALAG